MRRDKTRSEQLHEQAVDVFPGGVSHNIRYFSPHPIYIDRAEGCHLWDVDGNQYVDFWMNHMSSVLGHSHPNVVDAVTEQAASGIHYGAPNEAALELGERVKEYVPSAESVRFCGSGTEATMYAVRLARAATDRKHVLKAEGGWHGGNTDLTMSIHAPFSESETAGLPPESESHLHSFPVNNRGEVNQLVEQYHDDIAAIIIEPMLLAGGGVQATTEFLSFLRDVCDQNGISLIFDEVVTGFRVSPGSYQARIGVLPDLTTLGKVLGGGLPVGAVAGSAEYFQAARPDIDVSPEKQVLAGGGTFSMNPSTAQAGLATLDVIEEEQVYDYTEHQARRVRESLSDTLTDLGVNIEVLGTSSLFLVHFQPQTELTSVRAVETQTNRHALKEYHKRLIDRGFYFLPGHMGSVSYQTPESQLDSLIEAAEKVVKEMQADDIL